MPNLKLDIEKQIWDILNKEPRFYYPSLISKLLPARLRALANLGDCTEIVEVNNIVAQKCREIAQKHRISAELKIFEGENGKIDNVVGCISGEDFFFLHYHPRLLNHLTSSEISFSIEHEFGHFFSYSKDNPEELLNELIYSSGEGMGEDYKRMRSLAIMLSHISEYNADRFAAFDTKDISGYNRSLRKLAAAEKEYFISSNLVYELPVKAENNQMNILNRTHPGLDERESALNILEPYICDPEFDINKTPEVYNKMLELLCYKEFMEEFGGYYKER